MKAYVFPGQGVQRVGMGKKEWENSTEVKMLFDTAAEIVGPDLQRIMFEGPAEELDQTINAQPAIFLASYSRYLLAKGPPDLAAGHSLGEFTALTAAGAFDFVSALRLVSRRAELMHWICQRTDGAMAAIKGLDLPSIRIMCHETSLSPSFVAQAANINSPDEIVISGHREAVEAVMNWVRRLESVSITQLRVAGAFHSPLMEPARALFETALREVLIQPCRFPVYSSIEAVAFGSTEHIRSLLDRQLSAPVRWHDTIEKMVEDGANHFTDIGPRRVLYSLLQSSFPLLEVEVPGFSWDLARSR